jgi:hypothetical protein
MSVRPFRDGGAERTMDVSGRRLARLKSKALFPDEEMIVLSTGGMGSDGPDCDLGICEVLERFSG